jgi:hypothetical protein
MSPKSPRPSGDYSMNRLFASFAQNCPNSGLPNWKASNSDILSISLTEGKVGGQTSILRQTSCVPALDQIGHLLLN